MATIIMGGGGTDSLLGGNRSLAGTAQARGLGSVDPRLVQIIDAAAARSPYDVQIFSGKRFGSVGGSRHNSGNALDIALIDPSTGQVIPNYKSSTGFPIYAEFAKVAREEQMQIAPDLADAFRWGGGFSDKDFDLMHFDIKPGGGMAYWTWEDGGKLTPAGEKAVPQFGAGWVYANGEKWRAPEGQYASLWGRDPLPAPQNAQSAIASLIAPSGGSSVPDMPTAAMGYAPNLTGGMEPPVPQMPQVAAAPPPPAMPTPPPQWAQGGFPIDEALSGASALDVLMGGPRSDPRRIAPGTGPMPPDMGAMLSPADVLAAGPRMRPGGAPDASAVPVPRISPMNPSVGGPNDRRPQPPTPPMRPGGAPDAASVPNPPPRAQGIPNPPSNPRRDPYGFPIDVNRPRLNNGDGSFSTEQTITFDASEVGLPSEIVTVPTIINGRKVSDDEAMAAFAAGQNEPVQRGFGSFADADKAAEARTGSIAAARATNGERGFPRFYGEQPQPGPAVYADALDRFDTEAAAPPPASAPARNPNLMMTALDEAQSRKAFEGPFGAGELRPQASPPPGPPRVGNIGYSDTPIRRLPQTQAAVTEPGMGLGPYGMTPPPLSPPSPFFDNANPGPTFAPPGMPSAAINIPKSPFEGSTGEGFTYAPPMPAPPPVTSQGLRDQFNVAFSPNGVAGQIYQMPTPPGPATAQGAIGDLMGSSPAAAMGALPFTEEVGRRMDWRYSTPIREPAPIEGTPRFFSPEARTGLGDFVGSPPAAAATLASPLPAPPVAPTWGDMTNIKARFDDAISPAAAPPSVIAPPPAAPPAVVDEWAAAHAGPIDIRSPSAGGPPFVAPPVTPPVAPTVTPPRQPAPAPRNIGPGAERQKQGLALRILGSVLGGPMVGGLLGGGGGGGFGFGQGNAFTPFSGGPMINTGMGSFRSSGTAPNASGGMTTFQHGTAFRGASPATQFSTGNGRAYTYSSDPITGAPIGGFV